MKKTHTQPEHKSKRGARGYSAPSLAKKFGVDARTLRRYLADVKPVGIRDGVKLWTKAQARMALKKRPERGAVIAANSRLLSSKIALLEFQIADLKAKHISASEVDRALIEMKEEASRVFLAIPSRIAAELVTATADDAEKIIRDAIRAGLQHMHDRFSK